MKVLVTGAAGFIGFHTCKALLDRGDEVIGFDAFTPYYDPQLKERRHAQLEQRKGYRALRGDLMNEDALRAAFDALGSGPGTRVCHLAAQAGVRHSILHPEEFMQDNVVGTNRVLELCKVRGVEGLVYASSSSVYGDNADAILKEASNTDHQVSLYGMTKKANELQASVYHNLFGVRSTGLRFFTVYGPWGRPDMALFLFTDAILRGHPMKIFGHGKMQRDFTYVDDIVQGIVASLDRNYGFEVFNLGAGRSENLMDFVHTIEKTCGKEGEKEFLPMQQGDVVSTAADITLAEKKLGFKPETMVPEGVPRFVAWYREYYGI
jgi:UDP-glucuronate 4-epimerase